MTPRTQPRNRTPVGGLMDKRFNYVPACKTDIRETFKRVLAEQKRKKQ